MDPAPSKGAQGEREFRVEVDVLSRLNHPNLVQLIGYCADSTQRILVYEFMPNGNLQEHLHGEHTPTHLWRPCFFPATCAKTVQYFAASRPGPCLDCFMLHLMCGCVRASSGWCQASSGLKWTG